MILSDNNNNNNNNNNNIPIYLLKIGLTTATI